MVLAIVADIAVQLEIAPKGLQLRAESPDMTGRAGLAGLDRKSRNCKRRISSKRSGEKCNQKSGATGPQSFQNHRLGSFALSAQWTRRKRAEKPLPSVNQL